MPDLTERTVQARGRTSTENSGGKREDRFAIVAAEPRHLQQVTGEQLSEVPERVTVPDYAALLPEQIRQFTTKGVYDAENAHLSFTQGGGHGGSHPHLV